MSALNAGDSFPEGVTFKYVKPTGQLDITACGLPVDYNASEGTYEYLLPQAPALPPRLAHSHLHLAQTDTSSFPQTEFKNKKVVLVSVPGAFTPLCQEQHIQSYINSLDKLKAKGVDQVIVIAYNDWWVMAAWAKANGIKDDSIVRLSMITHRVELLNDWLIG